MSSVVSSVFGGAGNAAGQVQSPLSQAQINQQYGNLQSGIDQQQAFLQALGAQNGIQNQSNVFNQLQNVANGQGPNPAQAMLNNATGANTANQAALMAGQRGASANPALIARQAAMQGAANQQQAAGQGAAMQANQQLNALGQLQNMSGQQVNQQQNALAQLQNASSAGLNTATGAQNATNQINSQAQREQAQMQGQMLGNVMGAAGSAVGMMAEGGAVQAGPRSKYGQLCMAEGGKVPALVSPGEQYLKPQDVKKVQAGSNPLKVGERIPGTPKVAGNSYANDTVHKTLDAGGIVIPNSVMQSKNPSKSAEEFVRQVLARKR